MATIVLQAAGAYLGGALGAVGATIGSAAGAVAGYLIDRALINSTQRYEGPRLAAARPFTAEEGASLPRLYGTVRVGGVMIWATRFQEDKTTERQGGKLGPKVTSYSYYTNVAFALCEGEIAGVRRIWADGREIDRERFEIRIYRGTEDQPVDPLLEAKQGAGNAPAYRGTAYVVIERFPIDDYGRRIPQFHFEVMRPAGELNDRIKSVTLIPGSTEYGLSPTLVKRSGAPGENSAVNRHNRYAPTDIEASLDELQMLCPNLKTVSLVVTWFGTDLRAGECQIRPMVTQGNSSGLSAAWIVSGVSRQQAQVVSVALNDAPAYGGTPTDNSVRQAIAAIRGRGLKVGLYPFVMMDIPAGNELLDPYDDGVQPPYPWRGQLRVAARAVPWTSQAVLVSPEATGFNIRSTLSQRGTIGVLEEVLPGGVVEGRIDRSSSVTVRLHDGELQSVSRLQVLNGANAAAIRAVSGVWEVLQFEEAEEIEPSVWLLSGLLRGQLGTNDAMAVGSESGAPFVILDDAVTPAGLRPEEIGLELNWRVGPVGYDISGENYLPMTTKGGERALMPLSPVHLKGRMEAGNLYLSWVRRGRVDADGWLSEEIPLGEDGELYRVEIAPVGDSAVRRTVTSEPAWTYTAAMLAADFADTPSAIDVTVRQMSAAIGAGMPLRRTVLLP